MQQLLQNRLSDIDRWFAETAELLLNKSIFFVDDKPHRFAEIEFYYNNETHADVFTHGDPLQKTCGRWYFHRMGKSYRNGSFKGVDITFGEADAFGGILIRSIETPEGQIIEGPSLCVDHLLAQTNSSQIAALDEMAEKHHVWEKQNTLAIQQAESRQKTIFRSPRVGLSLKKAEQTEQKCQYIMRPYRFFITPQRIRKGKIYIILALHCQGVPPAKIHQLTRSPVSTIERYIEDFQEGCKERDFAPYLGAELKPKALARLYGTWSQVENNPNSA